ncbi:hypothetical protein OQA88_7207 [Cercophora sp. LCS_1]
MALRPSLPNVHVFRAHDAYECEQFNPQHEALDYHLKNGSSLWVCLAAPRPLHTGVASSRDPTAVAVSWTANNPSTYLVDAGLWTACQESKRVMEREHDCYFRLDGIRSGLAYLEYKNNADHFG